MKALISSVALTGGLTGVFLANLASTQVVKPALDADILARVRDELVGTQVPPELGSKWGLSGGAVYVCGPISPCSLEAQLPEQRRPKAYARLVFIYGDVPSGLVKKPGSALTEIKFDPGMRLASPQLHAMAPLLMVVDSRGKIRSVTRPIRTEKVSHLMALARLPE